MSGTKPRLNANAVIVEDEPLARRTLRELVEEVAWLELTGEAADGRAALTLVDELRPDVLFLDVRLPEISGLDVLERIGHEPSVVFTTACDHYAVTAFELGAVDYLLKPFGPDRFRTSMERLRERLPLGTSGPPARERVSELLDEGARLRRLFVREGRSILPVDVDEVIRFEGADDYVVMHLAQATHILSTTLGALEERLDPSRFVRAHRSHLVNLDHASMMTLRDRRLAIQLSDGSEILASRARSAELRRRLT